MNVENIKGLNTDENESEFNFIEQLEKYLSYWKLFVVSVIICLIISFLFVRYQKPENTLKATILIKDDKKGGMSSELSSFADLGMLGGLKSNADNEAEILKSRTLVKKVVLELGLNIEYFIKGRVINVQSYKDTPIKIDFFNKSKTFFSDKYTFSIRVSSGATYQLIDKDGKIMGEFSYGQTIKNKLGNMVVTRNLDFNDKLKQNSDIIINVRPLEETVNYYQKILKIEPVSKTASNVLNLFVTLENESIGIDFLNTLVVLYNAENLDDKNLVAQRTEAFINGRLKNITTELDSVESNIVVFKKANRLTNIESDADIFLETANEYEKFKVTNETELKVIEMMLEYIATLKGTDVIPANIIPNTGGATQLVETYNKIVGERRRIALNATDENQVIKTLDSQLKDLRTSIVQSLRSSKKTLEIKRIDLASQGNLITGKIGKIPQQEKMFRDISRKQQIKETLYLYLLQKREENAISLAVTSPNSKIIDAAYLSADNVGKKNIVFLAGFVVGLGIPFMIIFVIGLLDTKIKSRADIIGKVSVPFIGDVPKSAAGQTLITMSDRSSTAEAIRIIRTNLDFMLTDASSGLAKTIFLTSTFPTEGKTFNAVNLATTFALSNKKVLLIGLDVRKPKLEEYFTLPNRGVTTYLSSVNIDVNDLLVKQDNFNNFYVLPAGAVPPNPAELLMSPKLAEMFKILKSQFEYIIVDTAPVSLVTDTMIVSKFADTFVYVIKADFLDKRVLPFVESLYLEKKLPNMSLLLNNSKAEPGYGYGYGYGAGSSNDPVTFLKKITKFLNFRK